MIALLKISLSRLNTGMSDIVQKKVSCTVTRRFNWSMTIELRQIQHYAARRFARPKLIFSVRSFITTAFPIVAGAKSAEGLALSILVSTLKKSLTTLKAQGMMALRVNGQGYSFQSILRLQSFTRIRPLTC